MNRESVMYQALLNVAGCDFGLALVAEFRENLDFRQDTFARHVETLTRIGNIRDAAVNSIACLYECCIQANEQAAAKPLNEIHVAFKGEGFDFSGAAPPLKREDDVVTEDDLERLRRFVSDTLSKMELVLHAVRDRFSDVQEMLTR